MKKKTSFILILILTGTAWLYSGVVINKTTKAGLQGKVNEIWEYAIQIDYYNRLAEVGGKYISNKYVSKLTKNISDSLNIAIQTKREKQHLQKNPTAISKFEKDTKPRFIQTFLSVEHPIQPTHLDSLFRFFLKEKNIKATTAVVYLHNEPGNRSEYSTQDTTFFTKAFATKEIKTGIDNSIILRGFVNLSWLDYIHYSSLFYFLWIISGIFVLSLLYFYKRNVSAFTPDTNIQTEIELVPTEINYQRNKRILTYGKTELTLTRMQALFLNCLIENDDFYQPHDIIIKQLWPDGEGDKKKLEQLRSLLQKKLKSIPVLSISVSRGAGCTLLIEKSHTFIF